MQNMITLWLAFTISKIIKIIFKENTFINYSVCSPTEAESSVNSFI